MENAYIKMEEVVSQHPSGDTRTPEDERLNQFFQIGTDHGEGDACFRFTKKRSVLNTSTTHSSHDATPPPGQLSFKPMSSSSPFPENSKFQNTSASKASGKPTFQSTPVPNMSSSFNQTTEEISKSPRLRLSVDNPHQNEQLLFSPNRSRIVDTSVNVSPDCTMDKILLENSSLKLELQNKTNQLNMVKRQVKALLDLDFQETVTTPNTFEDSTLPENDITYSTSPRTRTPRLSLFVNSSRLPTKNDLNISELPSHIESPVENVNTPANSDHDNYFMPGFLPEHTFILIREIRSQIEVHQVRERMVEGLQFSNQFVLGGASGWIGAYLVKNFGKTALTAVGGGLLILAFATKKGFIEINWNKVLVELQRRGETQELLRQQSRLSFQNDDNNASTTSSLDESALSVGEDWTVEKIRAVKRWISEHSVAVAGCAVGFLYNIL